jgi:hypothetical protein
MLSTKEKGRRDVRVTRRAMATSLATARRWLPLAATALSTGVFAYGCSSGDSTGSPSDAAASDAATGDDSQSNFIPPSSSGGSSGGNGSNNCVTPVDLNAGSMWKPPPYKHARVQANACTDQEIMGWDAACISGASVSTTCVPYETAHATCTSCLISMSSAATWGPLVSWPTGVYTANTSGCMEIVDPSGTCAASAQANEQCGHAACDPVCTGITPSAIGLRDQCVRMVKQAGGECLTFAQASLCLSTDGAAPPAISACNSSGGGFEADFLKIAPRFCGSGGAGGPPSTDSGTTPVVDAGAPVDAPPG